MLESQLYKEALKKLALDPSLIKIFSRMLESGSMPNIPFPTMGGHVWWDTLAEYDGWKLQQNKITQHARILNNDDVRVAWGSVEAMERALGRIVESSKSHDSHDRSGGGSQERQEKMEELKKLKELLDMGAITQEEFEEKKKSIMASI